MTYAPQTTGAAPPARMSLPARYFGIGTSPKSVYQSVVAHPHWLGMLVFTTLIAAVSAALPSTTPEGQQAALDEQVRQRTRPIATGLLVVYGLIALCIAAVMSSFGGSH